MTNLERLMLRTGSDDEELLSELLETAKNAILSRRFPLGDYPTREVERTNANGETVTELETYVEDRYLDLQFRIALDLFNKQGAEGESSHTENGIGRTYESSWISSQLLQEVVPYIGSWG